MSQIRNGMIWGALLIMLAAANALGWIADKDAATMFAIVPALWAATSTAARDRCGVQRTGTQL